MNFDLIQFLLFTTGSVVLVVFSLISMIIHQKVDGYSIKHDRLSYTGVRNDFTHPVRDTHYTKSSYPEILNLSLVASGILFLLAFFRVEDLGIMISGLMFSLSIVIIGWVDVSSNYTFHNRVVIASQPLFLLLIINILIVNYNLFTVYTLIIIFILVMINIYQKQIQNRNPEKIVNVIPQKLFIYIEALYFIFLTFIID